MFKAKKPLAKMDDVKMTGSSKLCKPVDYSKAPKAAKKAIKKKK